MSLGISKFVQGRHIIPQAKHFLWLFHYLINYFCAESCMARTVEVAEQTLF